MTDIAMPAEPYLLSQEGFSNLRGIPYIDFLKYIADHVNPQSYFEIGTETGRSCKQFTCPSVCVDPQFKLTEDVISGKTELHLFQMPSDVFFRTRRLGKVFDEGIDVCFLDGMHRCEYLLRDFMNAEKYCHSRSLVLLHDCMPRNQRMALRTHEIGAEEESEDIRYAWTGDVWRVVPILMKYRADLKISLIDCPPSGLVAISNLDPESTVIEQNYANIVREMHALSFAASPFETYPHQPTLISSAGLIAKPEDFSLLFNIW